jgi:bleomycin hydrolase
MAAKKTRKKTAARKPAAPAKLTGPMIQQMRENFLAKPVYTVMQNAITHTSVDGLAWQHNVTKDSDHSYSVKLDKWTATNQMGSGRCWMFAAMNLFRVGAMKKLKLDNFEFSQNYPLFWDKLEKANFYLESIIDTAGRDIDDRTVSHLIRHPVDDGGQWNMFIDLVHRHGLVPKAVMPETQSSSSTGSMNGILTRKLRLGAKQLRDMFADGAKVAALREKKGEILNEVHRILTIHLGTPPEKFDWQWTDKAGKLHRQKGMTPKRFAEMYVTVDMDDYVCLVHDPRPTSPIGRTFTVEYLGNVVGGKPVVYLNVDVELIKKITMKTLQDGEPVWFGCDVGQMMHRDTGMWDAEVQNFEDIYDMGLSMDKADRLYYGSTAMSHAMLFTGVDVVGGKPRRWRVENSWGTDKAQGGFYRMNDSWFNEHMFEIAAKSKYLPVKLRDALKKKPIVLPAWDPMGSLAREALS